MKTMIAILTAGLSLCVGTPKDNALKAEWAKLNGTWQLMSAENDGKKAPEDFVKTVRVVIRDGKHTVHVGDQVAAKEIPFTIDPTKKPKQAIDTLPDGKQIHSIYEIDGDTLRSCVAPVGKDRPKEFSGAAGTGNTLRVFKRVKE
jgi:uncharacterized protein (TIGR03067 family)